MQWKCGLRRDLTVIMKQILYLNINICVKTISELSFNKYVKFNKSYKINNGTNNKFINAIIY